MKASRNQRGFTLIEGLLITLIVLFIGFIAYYVHHSQQQTNKTLSSAQSDSVSVAKTASAIKTFADCQKSPGSVDQQSYPEVCVTKSGQHFTQPTSTSSQSYFMISEWGVRAPYSGSDTFTYKLSNGNKLATVISKNLAASSSDCSTYGAGQISRLAPTDGAYADGTGPTVQDYAKQYPSDYTIVGGYYYQFRHDQAVCGSADAQNQANTTVKSLVAAFQAVPVN